jgi:hypothetical protein
MVLWVGQRTRTNSQERLSPRPLGHTLVVTRYESNTHYNCDLSAPERPRVHDLVGEQWNRMTGGADGTDRLGLGRPKIQLS